MYAGADGGPSGYLAQDVDGIAPFESQLIRVVSMTVPHSLVVVGIVCALVHWEGEWMLLLNIWWPSTDVVV